MSQIIVTFDGPDAEQQVQRLMYLANRDLCRVVGAQVIASEKLDDGKLSGRQRSKAVQAVDNAPKHEETLGHAMSALQSGLAAARKRWERIGGAR